MILFIGVYLMDIGDNDIFWNCESHWIWKYVLGVSQANPKDRVNLGILYQLIMG